MSITLTQEQLQSLIQSTENTLGLLKSVCSDILTTSEQPVLVSRMFDLEDRPYELWLAPPSTEISSTWDEAMSYADKAEICGYTDWVVPDREELLHLYRLLSVYYLFDDAPYKIISDNYWSSNEGGASGAWRQNFSYGNQSTNSKSGNGYLRLVRRVYID